MEQKASAVYRFASATDHFYTIYESERDEVLRTRPEYKYEGIAFYAFKQPPFPSQQEAFEGRIANTWIPKER